jgi:flagellar M-ring protein FliF
MRTRATDTFRRLLGTFGSFSAGQKTVAALAVVGIIVGGFLFSHWVSAPSYAPLFSNLAAEDASAIVDKLQSSSTPYELTDGGATIMVPQDKVYDLRLTMSGEGLPAQKDSGGYSLLDKQGVTASDFQQHVTYQRALEGEIAKTVQSLDGVKTAVVHLAMPEKSVFAEETDKPTAAVLVDLKPGAELSNQQVRAVVNLVASSVPDLDPDAVTVANSEGTVLSAPGEESTGSGAGDTRSQMTKEYQDQLGRELQKMMDKIVGPGKSVAQVTAQLDFDQTQKTSESFTNPSPSTAPLIDNSSKEVYSGNGTTGSNGVLGPDNIQVPTGAGASSGTGGAYSKETIARSNAINKITELRKSAPGAVQRLSVAVVLDAKASSKLTPSQVQTLVATAAGIDPKRGDSVVVSQMPFDTSAAEQTKKDLASANAGEQKAQMMSMAKTGGLALLILIVVFIAWRSSRKTRRSGLSRAEMERVSEADRALLEEARALALTSAGSGRAALESGSPSPELDPSHAKREEIAAMVERQPDEVAALLRGWLADRRS